MRPCLCSLFFQSKLGNLPKEEQDKIVTLVTKNPKLFEEIALKIKQQMDGGKDQMAAAMSVMGEYKERIQALMSENK